MNSLVALVEISFLLCLALMIVCASSCSVIPGLRVKPEAARALALSAPVETAIIESMPYNYRKLVENPNEEIPRWRKRILRDMGDTRLHNVRFEYKRFDSSSCETETYRHVVLQDRTPVRRRGFVWRHLGRLELQDRFIHCYWRQVAVGGADKSLIRYDVGGTGGKMMYCVLVDSREEL